MRVLPVVGFETRYWISDEGEVSGRRGHALKTQPLKGYEHVVLWQDKKAHNRYVHRLVLEAFVGPCPPGEESRHGDNNRMNNRLGNLCWGTRVENADDKVRHGSSPELERNGRAILTNVEVLEVYRRVTAGEPLAALALEFGLSEVTVSHIKTGQTWGDLTGAVYKQRRAFLTPALIDRMKALRVSGLNLQQIADTCNVGKATAFRHSGAA